MSVLFIEPIDQWFVALSLFVTLLPTSFANMASRPWEVGHIGRCIKPIPNTILIIFPERQIFESLYFPNKFLSNRVTQQYFHVAFGSCTPLGYPRLGITNRSTNWANTTWFLASPSGEKSVNGTDIGNNSFMPHARWTWHHWLVY